MTVLYRATWSDKPTSELDQVLEGLKVRIAAWSQENSEPAPLQTAPTELVVSQDRHRRVDYRPIGAEAFEVTVTDQIPGDPAEWTVVIRVVADDTGMHTLVENHMQSDDLTQRVTVGRPWVVHELLTVSKKPSLGSLTLLTEPLSIPANGMDILVDLLADTNRVLPVIVCTQPGGERGDEWLWNAEKIARRTEGVAVVITLDNAAVTAFRSRLDWLAIWGGGVRVYAPGRVTAESEGWRHRYYRGSLFDEARQPTIDRIVYAVTQLSARRRVPGVFGLFGEQNGLPANALDGMIPATDLVEARDEWEFERELARDEHSALQQELAAANGHLARLKEGLISRGLADVLWGTKHEDTTSIPDEVQDTSEATLAAQTYLTRWLALPDSAVRDLEDIDTAPNAFAWGNTTWRGLRALAAYAEDRASGWDAGGFWEWCASGPVLGWPATSKKLSMTESDYVQNTLSRSREFKVDPRVEESGEIKMLAHLKISEGGGPLAPRVYFYDDTNGATKMVHVGLVGPHYLVPNKSTN
ncbi:hypothetical protein [Agromyces cerinus]|uniref:Uncharacterized protein n=1 Tax=Agromyces cerinus subsp. cerinus TaxID=232089 RepID=A0A1N6DSC0_9MICO|nr:hypothetical protein [Agromyces cerinus]SIN73676.1 hypothetical protein SAMN05443544_0676 [Agromyces cerinus subsp. cerinus]